MKPGGGGMPIGGLQRARRVRSVSGQKSIRRSRNYAHAHAGRRRKRLRSLPPIVCRGNIISLDGSSGQEDEKRRQAVHCRRGRETHSSACRSTEARTRSELHDSETGQLESARGRARAMHARAELTPARPFSSVAGGGPSTAIRRQVSAWARRGIDRRIERGLATQ